MMNLQKITVFIVSVVAFGAMNLCAPHLGLEDEIEFLIERLSILEQEQNELTRRVEELVHQQELVALQDEYLNFGQFGLGAEIEFLIDLISRLEQEQNELTRQVVDLKLLRIAISESLGVVFTAEEFAQAGAFLALQNEYRLADYWA